MFNLISSTEKLSPYRQYQEQSSNLHIPIAKHNLRTQWIYERLMTGGCSVHIFQLKPLNGIKKKNRTRQRQPRQVVG